MLPSINSRDRWGKEAAPGGPASISPVVRSTQTVHPSGSHHRTSCNITGPPGWGAPLQIGPMPAIAATIWEWGVTPLAMSATIRGTTPLPVSATTQGGPTPLAMCATTRGSHPISGQYRCPAPFKIKTESARPPRGSGRVTFTHFEYLVVYCWSAAYNCSLAALQLCLIYLEGSAFSAETLPSAHPLHFCLTLASLLSPLYHSLSTFSLLLLFLSYCPHLSILFLCYSFSFLLFLFSFIFIWIFKIYVISVNMMRMN